MHNGGIADFHLIKRKLQSQLPDVAFDMVQGNTGEFYPQLLSIIQVTRPLRLRVGLCTLPVKGNPGSMAAPLSSVSHIQPASGSERHHLQLPSITKGDA